MTLDEAGTGDPLIPRTIAGDMDALSLLYRRHAADMLGVAYRLLGSRSDAEDLIQDLFAALPETLRGYREAGRFGGWLRQLTVRQALMQLRSGKRRREWSLEESIPAVDPADGAVLRETLGKLSENDRTIVMLKAIEGYTHSEIADLLGIKRGTAEVRLLFGGPRSPPCCRPQTSVRSGLAASPLQGQASSAGSLRPGSTLQSRDPRR